MARRRPKEVAPPPFRHGVGEHGETAAEEGARFHLQEDLPPSIPEEEIEASPPEGHLPLQHPRPFQARDEAPMEEKIGGVVGLLGVEGDRDPLPDDGHGRIGQLPTRRVPPRGEEDPPSREEELPKAAGVGEMGQDIPAVHLHLDDETIGPSCKETGRDHVDEGRRGEVPRPLCGGLEIASRRSHGSPSPIFRRPRRTPFSNRGGRRPA